MALETRDVVEGATETGSAGLAPQTAMRASFMSRPFLYWPALLVGLATILISAVAIAWPAIDQLISAQFYAGAGRFPARDVSALRALYFAGNAATQLVIVGLLVLLIGKLLGHPLVEAVSWRVWWFLSLSLAICPGLIINGVLKPLMHRPRPMQTDLFGGDEPFVRAWRFGETGLGNRSFPSAEAAAAMYLVAFALVVPKTWRKRVATFALLWAFAISLNRVAFGAHYLSDILVAWGLTLIVILLIRILILSDLERHPSE
jgi:membrane-associated phospholipid phosphatase